MVAGEGLCKGEKLVMPAGGRGHLGSIDGHLVLCWLIAGRVLGLRRQSQIAICLKGC
jgi:hypothetical protein